MSESLTLMTQEATFRNAASTISSSKFCLPRQELIQEQCGWRNAGGPEKFGIIIIFFLIIFTLPAGREGGGFLPGRGSEQLQGSSSNVNVGSC